MAMKISIYNTLLPCGQFVSAKYTLVQRWHRLLWNSTNRRELASRNKLVADRWLLPCLEMENMVWGRKFCVALLRACAQKKDLCRGTRVHADVLKRGLLEKSSYVATTLVSMYAKCGELTKAKVLLDGLPVRSVFSWNALLAGYAQQGHGEEALNCFAQMQCEGLSPDEVTFTCILKACGSIGAADKGEQIHDEIVRQGFLGKDIVLGNALVDMYAKCGALPKARQVFDELPVGNVVSWNALIGGYAQHGHGEEALNCFELMRCKGLSPDAVTFTCILKACGSLGAINKGEQIHDEIAGQGLLGKDIVLGNALLDMYAKCGAFAKAEQVLNELLVENVVSWNALIAGYAQHGQGEEALKCFERMERKGLSPNAVTFTCILKACGSLGAADKGEHIHDEIVRQGLLKNNVVLGNALVDMYAKCGAVTKAHRVLNELPTRNVTSWNAVIAGYALQGQGEDALNSYERMRGEGLSPNAVTFTYVLKACGCIGVANKGEQIHDEIIRQGLLARDCVHDIVFLGNALVDMYSKCGALAKAQEVLEELPVRDVVMWNAVIAGYAQQGQGVDALHCFEQMQCKGLSPDAITFTCILKACGNIGAADKGEHIHDVIAKQGLLEKDIVLGNALVDMYAKCGALAKARQVLEELPVGDAVSWNALLGGYAQQGQGQDALDCVEQMQHKGLSPDAVTFSCILTACSHSGLLDEGQTCFTDMSTKYGILPDVEHYTCMVDLFGRAGHFDKAVAMIERMPSSDYPAVWAALLGACRKWGDVIVARWAFEHAIQVDKSDAAFYVCMANIYAAAGMQEDAELIEAMRVKNKAWNTPSCSGSTDMDENVDAFFHTNHAQSSYIDVELQDALLEA